ncbi:Cubilin [Trichinella zimbabwensis]|uniref:Cubilin n=1 Tax=Trichinella zimbabwensis TaxID=268475 RepID=A0A0V1HCT8_9BILA|nr:Cubilin [Trichinella zimbabwensis]
MIDYSRLKFKLTLVITIAMTTIDHAVVASDLQLSSAMNWKNSCSTNSSLIKKTALVLCPNTGAWIQAGQICDGHTHCSGTRADELTCVRDVNISNVSQEQGRSDQPIAAVQAFVNALGCWAPLCNNENPLISLLLCRSVGAAVPSGSFPLANVHLRPAVNVNKLQCHTDADRDFQSCLANNAVEAAQLLVCSKLFGLHCLKKCEFVLQKRNGTLKSVGFPSVQLPNLNCRWNLTAPDNHVIVIHFEHFNVHPDDSQECKEQGYVELGFKDTNNTVKLCKLTTPHKKYTSLTNSMWIRHVSADKPLRNPGAQGFLLRFQVVAMEMNLGQGPLKSTNVQLTPTMITIIAVATAMVISVIVLIIASASQFNRKLRNRRTFSQQMTTRQVAMDEGSLVQLHRNNLTNLTRKVFCPECQSSYTSSGEFCPHMQTLVSFMHSPNEKNSLSEMLKYHFQRFNSDLPVDVNNNNNVVTTVSSATIDLDQMYSGASLIVHNPNPKLINCQSEDLNITYTAIGSKQCKSCTLTTSLSEKQDRNIVKEILQMPQHSSKNKFKQDLLTGTHYHFSSDHNLSNDAHKLAIVKRNCKRKMQSPVNSLVDNLHRLTIIKAKRKKRSYTQEINISASFTTNRRSTESADANLTTYVEQSYWKPPFLDPNCRSHSNFSISGLCHGNNTTESCYYPARSVSRSMSISSNLLCAGIGPPMLSSTQQPMPEQSTIVGSVPSVSLSEPK